MKIVIVGIGALGSHVALFGRNWAGTLNVIDGDRVEQKNTLGQFHTTMGLGKNKALALKQASQGLFKGNINALPHMLTEDNVAHLLGNADFIIDCTDNIEARTLIQRFARAVGITCLHGALSADGTFGRVMWTEHFVPDAEGAVGQATCEGGENLPFHGLVAAKVAAVAQEFLKTGKKSSWQIAGGTFIRLA